MFLYAWREREDISRIYENVSGQRMMSSYFRIGGLSLEPPLDFYKQVQTFLNKMPSAIDQYENMLTGNPIWMGRLKGVGYLSAADAIALGVSGPPLRASGVDWDLRRDMPYSSYEKFQFARCRPRLWAMFGRGTWCVWRRCVRAVKICQQALDGMPRGAEASRSWRTRRRSCCRTASR